MLYQLEWTDSKGAYHCETGSERIAKKLETIRAKANLWLINDKGQRVDKIGHCEPADGRQDDKRIKWFWWYELPEKTITIYGLSSP